jgi:putative nucleotidyltransferase with HDIG domain
MGDRNLRFLAYVGLVVVSAAIGIWLSWQAGQNVPLGWTMATLAVAVLVSELLAVELPDGGTISLTYPLFVCAIVLVGPTAASALVAVSMIPSLFAHPRMSGARLLGNLGQLVLTVLLPGWLYLGLEGRLLSIRPIGGGDIPNMLAPLLVASTLGVFVNAALFVAGYGIMHRVSARQVWRIAVSWALASQVALGLLGLAIAQVMASEGWLGFALFVVPLVVARQTHSRYLSLREAYADTVRSLVAAIEAKDPYTKGHSIRVARFSVAIAEAMSLEEGQAQNIEYAALLHDLGKIGISRAVLAKTGALTDEEYGSIKEHPAIGARILESVPFLDSVRPAVQDHHERVDGKGYGRRISGAELSVEARILAVADSYDAMTADRPYRDALSADAAIAELRVNSGTQFDQEIVEAFLSILPGLEREEPEQIEAVQGGVSLAEA